MRTSLALIPLLALAAPAIAAQPQPQLPPQLTDPATIQRMTNAMQALSNALLNVKVGGVVFPADCASQMGIIRYKDGKWISIADGHNGKPIDTSTSG